MSHNRDDYLQILAELVNLLFSINDPLSTENLIRINRLIGMLNNMVTEDLTTNFLNDNPSQHIDLLSIDPPHRPSIQDLMNHPFMTEVFPHPISSNNFLSHSTNSPLGTAQAQPSPQPSHSQPSHSQPSLSQPSSFPHLSSSQPSRNSSLQQVSEQLQLLRRLNNFIPSISSQQEAQTLLNDVMNFARNSSVESSDALIIAHDLIEHYQDYSNEFIIQRIEEIVQDFRQTPGYGIPRSQQPSHFQPSPSHLSHFQPSHSQPHPLPSINPIYLTQREQLLNRLYNFDTLADDARIQLMRDITRFISDVRDEDNIAYQIALDLRVNLTDYDDQEIADRVRTIINVLESITQPLPPTYQAHPLLSPSTSLSAQNQPQEMLYEILRRTHPLTIDHEELDQLMIRVMDFVRDHEGTDNDAYVLAQDIMENYRDYDVNELEEKLRLLTTLVQSIEINISN
jgi:hypothetical protein